MKIRDVMTEPAITVGPDDALSLVAARMREHGIGALPVVEGERLVGIVTDRDLVVSLVEEPGESEGLRTRHIMTADVVCCYEDDGIEGAAHTMGDYQIRRLPVLDRSGKLVGIVSLGDIAENVSEQLAGETLGEIVEAR